MFSKTLLNAQTLAEQVKAENTVLDGLIEAANMMASCTRSLIINQADPAKWAEFHGRYLYWESIYHTTRDKLDRMRREGVRF